MLVECELLNHQVMIEHEGILDVPLHVKEELWHDELVCKLMEVAYLDLFDPLEHHIHFLVE